jgi:hypothetical protein
MSTSYLVVCEEEYRQGDSNGLTCAVANTDPYWVSPSFERSSLNTEFKILFFRRRNTPSPNILHSSTGPLVLAVWMAIETD